MWSHKFSSHILQDISAAPCCCNSLACRKWGDRPCGGTSSNGTCISLMQAPASLDLPTPSPHTMVHDAQAPLLSHVDMLEHACTYMRLQLGHSSPNPTHVPNCFTSTYVHHSDTATQSSITNTYAHSQPLWHFHLHYLCCHTGISIPHSTTFADSETNCVLAITLIGHVAMHNPEYVIPSLRKALIQLLIELEYSTIMFVSWQSN